MTLSIAALRRMAKHALADHDSDTACVELRCWVRDNCCAVGAALGRSPSVIESASRDDGTSGVKWVKRLLVSLDVASDESRQSANLAMANAANDEGSVLGASARVDSGGAWLSMRLLALAAKAAKRAGYDLVALDFGGTGDDTACFSVAALAAVVAAQRGEHDVVAGPWLAYVSRSTKTLSLRCKSRGYTLPHRQAGRYDRCLHVLLGCVKDSVRDVA